MEGDLFSWYIQGWTENIYRAIQQIIKYLNDYDPETMEIAPDETRDILKKLYQYLVPKQIRHDLGEYYTPDWLADRCLNQLSYNGDLSLRILDPACGSGTFLILAIKRAKEFARKKNIEPTDLLNKIFTNIQGFDLNPLAVISARTNYLMAIADLLKYKKGEITVPVYLCDSINPPQSRVANEMTLFEEKRPYEVKTTVGNFLFSHSIINRLRIQQLAILLEDGVKTNKSTSDFMKKVERELQLTIEEFKESKSHLIDTYEKLVELERKGINGVWARIIKNAFAPLFVGVFDFIVGNPPWVNWEALPQGYRDETKPLWIKYGLFSLSGHEARLGGGKKDISMLMTYVAIDKYLKNNGKLCFVITQSVFKTTGAGDGFRGFRIVDSNQVFKVEQVDDMVNLQPFEGATNRTSVMTIKKGQETQYPLSYVVWKKTKNNKISLDSTFKEVFDTTKRSNFNARPTSTFNSAWITGKGKTINVLIKIIGQSFYNAYEGANNGGLAGVYWIKIISKRNCLLEIENLFDAGKKIVSPYQGEVEENLIYPLLRWGDMTKWNANPVGAIIIPQDPIKRLGYPESFLKTEYPKTYSYFKTFEKDLWTRKSKTIIDIMEKSSFYALFSIGKHTFSKYKVCWQTMNEKLSATVIGLSDLNGQLNNFKTIVPQHTIVFIPTDNFQEAHYICSLMNNDISDFIARSYSMGKSFGNPHIMNNIPVPRFNETNPIHLELSKLSQNCCEKTIAGIDVTDLEENIDGLVAELWGITSAELIDIKDSLKEL